ncbi:hypothetical protein [Mesorhizobium caraganae]|uniref:hypothetical protein n=1 Tax=Mesorhizobium caraganae TaxID=483206 RepID=UPI00333B8929
MSRAEIIALVKRETNMVVRSGPFSGLRLHDVQTWGGGDDIGPQLLGVYEEELHGALCEFIDQKPNIVVNVGCAEGYYAVGLALSVPDARVIAFDIDLRAQEACRANADLNGVGERLRVEASCTPARLREILTQDPDALIVVDCEGYEKILFDEKDTVAALGQANVIIEMHEFVDRSILPRLTNLFSPSHRISIIRSGPRNPHEFSFLDGSSDADKWLLVCENRPELQRWLVCERRVLPGIRMSDFQRSASIIHQNSPLHPKHGPGSNDVAGSNRGACETGLLEGSGRLGARSYEIGESGRLSSLYRPLVCTIVYGPDEYFECLRWFLFSLCEFGNYEGEVVVITDRSIDKTANYVPDNLRQRVILLHTSDISHSTRYTLNDLVLGGYSPILYIDNDVVVDGDIESTIKDINESCGVCVTTEIESYKDLVADNIGKVHDTRRVGNWFGLELLKTDLDCANEKLPLANSGIIGFRNKYDFEIVADIVRKLYSHPSHRDLVKYFGDQPLLNYALVKTNLGSYGPLSEKCRFAAAWHSSQVERRGFVHFVWARGEDKWKQMKSYVEFLQGKE